MLQNDRGRERGGEEWRIGDKPSDSLWLEKKALLMEQAPPHEQLVLILPERKREYQIAVTEL